MLIISYSAPSRGRPDRDSEETRLSIEKLQPPYDRSHWYFGAFLNSTGEMIGEVGFPDCVEVPRSGWPEGEILIKPRYWRQGYGTELLTAFLQSWWDLRRAVTKHQLHPALQGNKEPGERIMEGVALYVSAEQFPFQYAHTLAFKRQGFRQTNCRGNKQ